MEREYNQKECIYKDSLFQGPPSPMKSAKICDIFLKGVGTPDSAPVYQALEQCETSRESNLSVEKVEGIVSFDTGIDLSEDLEIEEETASGEIGEWDVYFFEVERGCSESGWSILRRIHGYKVPW